MRPFVLSLLGLSLVASSASAQHAFVVPVPPHGPDSAAIAAAMAEADTGRMVSGYRDLTPYNTPGYCYRAVESLTDLVWRQRERDTLVKYSAGDTIPTIARDVGRRCMAPMTPQSVLPSELYNFGVLANTVGDTAMARAVVEYQVSIAPNDAKTRAFIWADAIGGVAFHRPLQPRLAESFLPPLLALGPGAGPEKYVAYNIFRELYHDVFDTAGYVRTIRDRAALFRSLPPSDRPPSDPQTYGDSIEIVEYQQIPTLATTAHRLLDTAGKMFPLFKLAMLQEDFLTSRIGKPYPGLSGFAHFPDSLAGQLVPGHVTLIRYVGRLARGSGAVTQSNLAAYRRLYEKYKDRGFDVILVGATQGYAWSSPPLSPAEESKVQAWFYLDHLHLPFRLVVQETPYTRKPDGRRVDDKTDFEQQFFGAPGTAEVLIGRDGRLLTARRLMHSEVELDAWIARALAVGKH